jgi:DNA-binding response OmpR family regulator
VSKDVLCIDDGSFQVDAIELALGQAGFSVRIAEHVGAGLRRLDLQSFDVVVMGLETPVTSGVDLWKRLKTLAPMPRLVMFTAAPVSIVRGLHISVDRIVPKPDINQLLCAVRDCGESTINSSQPSRSQTPHQLGQISSDLGGDLSSPNPAALYGLANILSELGKSELSQRCAAMCLEAVVRGRTDDQVLRLLIAKRWPEVIRFK